MYCQNERCEGVALGILTHSQFELMPIAVPNATVNTLQLLGLCLIEHTFGSGLQWQDLRHVYPRNAIHRSAVIGVSKSFERSTSATILTQISTYT
jgi:hypothetical protein